MDCNVVYMIMGRAGGLVWHVVADIMLSSSPFVQ